MTDSIADRSTAEERTVAWKARLKERDDYLAALPAWDGAPGEAAWHAWFTSLDVLQARVDVTRNKFGQNVGLSKEIGDRLFRDWNLDKYWLAWSTVEKMLKQFAVLDLVRWQELHTATEEFINSGVPLPARRSQVPSPVGQIGPRPVPAPLSVETVPGAEMPEGDHGPSGQVRARGIIDLTESAPTISDDAGAFTPARRRRRIAAAAIVSVAAAAAAAGGAILSNHVAASTPEACPGPSEPSYTFSYPGAYSGPVYVRVCAAPGSKASAYQLKLVWGPKNRTADLVGVGRSGEAVSFTKTSAGSSYPITVSVTPPAPLIYGVGAPSGSTNIDSGWQR